MSETKAIGIDFGTDNSSVAVFTNGKTVVIPDEKGNLSIPSCVAYNYRGVLVGEDAKLQSNDNPYNTIFNSKRLVGGNTEDTPFKTETQRWPFEVTSDRDHNPRIMIDQCGKMMNKTPEKIVAMILLKLKHMAECYLESVVKDAVITVPVSFSSFQRQIIRNAASIAGLNVLRIFNDSCVASIPYNLVQKTQRERNVLIFVLGAAYLSVSIVNVCDGVFEVEATVGEPYHGAYHFDNNLINYLVSEFKTKNQIDISGDNVALQRIRLACEQAKQELVNYSEAYINIDSVVDGIGLNTKITLHQYGEICSYFFRSTLESIDEALSGARKEKSEIDEVVLIGKSCLIPKIQELISNHFPGKKLIIKPNEAIACSAAVQAAVLSGNKSPAVQNLLILNTASHSKGLEVAGGVMNVMLKKNRTIPTLIHRTFTTCFDNQTTMLFQIYEGERSMTKYNTCIGKVELSGITPAPRGVPQIEVTFNIDVNEHVAVSACDKSNGRRSCEVMINYDKKCSSEVNVSRKVEVSKN